MELADGTLLSRDEFDASEVLFRALQTKGKGAKDAVLHAMDLASTHLEHCCPMLGGVRHLVMGCCPGDWLHLMYVV